ncbi:MAG: DUF1311 domain-containing protein [Burkholderiales bacterium]|nr:DUF1311 domain-containing protein [Burkholderiales bacterium]
MKIKLFSLCCLCLTWLGLAQAADTLPDNFVGFWDVVSVAPDGKDQPHWQYQPADPQLLGREMHIAAAGLQFKSMLPDCSLTRWKREENTVGKLIGKHYERIDRNGAKRQPQLADFGLKLNAKQIVTVYAPECQSASKKADWDGMRFVFLNDKTLLLAFDASVVLTLEKRGEKQAVRASFNCAKASTKTEKAICSNHALAGYDRSISTAWRNALHNLPEESERLRREQAEWLKQRDACGSAVECLDETMWRRLDALMQEKK